MNVSREAFETISSKTTNIRLVGVCNPSHESIDETEVISSILNQYRISIMVEDYRYCRYDRRDDYERWVKLTYGRGALTYICKDTLVYISDIVEGTSPVDTCVMMIDVSLDTFERYLQHIHIMISHRILPILCMYVSTPFLSTSTGKDIMERVATTVSYINMYIDSISGVSPLVCSIDIRDVLVVCEVYSSVCMTYDDGVCDTMDSIRYMYDICCTMEKSMDRGRQAMIEHVTGWEGCGIDIRKYIEDPKSDAKKIALYVMSEMCRRGGEVMMGVFKDKAVDPKKAQSYRYNEWYDGESEDQTNRSIIEQCDRNDERLLMHAHRLYQSNTGRGFVGGRVLSGTIKTGDTVYFMMDNYDNKNKKTGLHQIQVQQVFIIQSNSTIENVMQGNAGNVVYLSSNIDRFFYGEATITNNPDLKRLKVVKASRRGSVLKCSVLPKNPQYLPKLIDGLRRLCRSTTVVSLIVDDDTGEHYLTSNKLSHIKESIDRLKTDTCGSDVIISDPMLIYKESISNVSKEVYVKSPNKHNRIYMQSLPISDSTMNTFYTSLDIVSSLSSESQQAQQPTSGVISGMMMEEIRQHALDNNAVDVSSLGDGVQRLWSMMGSNTTMSMMYNMTEGCQYIAEVKDACTSGFEYSINGGPLCEEKVTGVCSMITDAYLMPDAIHRGGGQIIPSIRRGIYGSMLDGGMTLLEPFYIMSIICHTSVYSDVVSYIDRCRFTVKDVHNNDHNAHYMIISLSISVMDTLRTDVGRDLLELTRGYAYVGCMEFEDYKRMPRDEQMEGLISAIRVRKGLNPKIPVVRDYIDDYI